MKTIIALIMTVLTMNVWGQEMNNMSNKDKMKYIFEKLNKDTMHLIDEFYHPQVDFTDPVGPVKGAKKLKAYYLNQYKNVNSIRFDFSSFYEQGSTVVGTWVMVLETDKLKSGKPIHLDGISVITFNEQGQAIKHRDYFDMGAFVYENIPLLGSVVKTIRKRFEVEEP